MMNRMEWLRKEIAVWRSENLIDEPTSQVLLERYQPKAPGIAPALIVSGIFCALLIGLGAISLFAANWDCLNRGQRALVSVMPAGICIAVALCGAVRGWQSAAFRESLGVLWSISIGAGVSLVAQTYQVGGNVPGLILFVALMTLPIVWLTRSEITMIFWSVFPAVWMSAFLHDSGPSWLLVLFSLLFTAASLPAFIGFARRKYPEGVRLGVEGAMGISFAITLSLILQQRLNSYGVSSALLIFSFLAGPFVVAVSGKIFKVKIWLFLSLVMAGFILMPAPFSNALWLYVLALVIAAGIIVYGIRSAQLKFLNLGCCQLLWQILGKFFESKLSFTVKGLVFLAAGVVLLAVNLFMIRWKKGRAL